MSHERATRSRSSFARLVEQHPGVIAAGLHDSRRGPTMADRDALPVERHDPAATQQPARPARWGLGWLARWIWLEVGSRKSEVRR